MLNSNYLLHTSHNTVNVGQLTAQGRIHKTHQSVRAIQWPKPVSARLFELKNQKKILGRGHIPSSDTSPSVQGTLPPHTQPC